MPGLHFACTNVIEYVIAQFQCLYALSSRQSRVEGFLMLRRIEDANVTNSCRIATTNWIFLHYQENMVFENHRKSLIQHCERSELRLHLKMPKMVHFGEFLKT